MNRLLKTVAAKSAIALCLAVLSIPAFAVNLITNGNFSTIASGDTTSADYSIVTQYLTNSVYGTGLPAWTVANLSNPPGNNILVCLVDYSQNTANANLCGTAFGGGMALSTFPGASPDGGNFLLVDALSGYNDPLQQTVAGLTPGSNYTLNFYEATAEQTGYAAPSGMTQQWTVTFGSQTQSGPLLSTPNQGSDPWAQVSLNFTATSASQLLSFAATGTPTGQPPMILLDGVSLTQTQTGGQPSAPEPSTYAMVGIGLLTFGWGMRKRKGKLLATRVPAEL